MVVGGVWARPVGLWAGPVGLWAGCGPGLWALWARLRGRGLWGSWGLRVCGRVCGLWACGRGLWALWAGPVGGACGWGQEDRLSCTVGLEAVAQRPEGDCSGRGGRRP